MCWGCEMCVGVLLVNDWGFSVVEFFLVGMLFIVLIFVVF